MTVAAAVPIYRYAGNDSATTFPFSQIFRSSGDLEVIRTDTGGNEITLVLDTDYTVTGAGTASSGSVEFPISGSSYYPGPLATGYKLTILRASDKARLTDMSEGFFFVDMNTGEDNTVMMVQELAEEVGRCVKNKKSNSATPPDLEDLIQTTVSDIERTVQFRVFKSDESVTVGDGVVFAGVGAKYDGWTITNVEAYVDDLGTATGSETLDIQIMRKRLAASVDVLTTKVTLDDTEYYAADGSVNTSNNTLATGDRLFYAVDTVQLTTAPLGLVIDITIQAP